MEDTSTSSRFPLYEAALEMIRTRPVRGAGLGTDAVRTAIKDMNLYHGTAPFVHSHNLYLQIWLETGLLGVVSYVAAMICGLKSAAKACKLHCPHEVRLITIGAAAAVAWWTAWLTTCGTIPGSWSSSGSSLPSSSPVSSWPGGMPRRPRWEAQVCEETSAGLGYGPYPAG